MSEDISAYIRLGVTVVVVTETVVSALIIANLAVTVYSAWHSNMMIMVANSAHNASIALLSQSQLTAPEVVRLVDSSLSKIYAITILPIAGITVSASYASPNADEQFVQLQNWCLENADKKFDVTYTVVISEGIDMYNIMLAEVDE